MCVLKLEVQSLLKGYFHFVIALLLLWVGVVVT